MEQNPESPENPENPASPASSIRRIPDQIASLLRRRPKEDKATPTETPATPATPATPGQNSSNAPASDNASHRQSETTSRASGHASRLSGRFGSGRNVGLQDGMSAVYAPGQDRYFRSRIVKAEQPIPKPWLEEKRTAREYLATIIPCIGALIGLCLAGFLIWDGYRVVTTNKYCPVLIDDFSGGLDPMVWSPEVEVGGFGLGQFEQTSPENVVVMDGSLYIRPTLQEDSLIENDVVIDLRGEGGCTGEEWHDCVTATNTANGSIVNPVKSGRVNTKAGASIKFGRVEVVAKLPAGDWLWPSILLMPTKNVYGPWPRSGQVDIMQSRGNDWTYEQGGNDIVSSTLHFGPNKHNDGWWRNNVKRSALHTTFSKGYHVFGVEWNEKYIFTYIDSRLLQVSYTHFDQPFWQYGQFPLANDNGTRFDDPWGSTGSYATPFDQDFHLVINLGVGATNGWFEDGKSGKPWVDSDPTAKRRFWDARDQWYPTWKEQGWLEIQSVKMWQQAGHNGCAWENATRFT